MINSIYALSASLNFNCDGCCVESKSFSITMTITNSENENVFVDAAKLDKVGGSTFATWGTVDGNGYNIPAGGAVTVSLAGTFPSPSSGNTLNYIPQTYNSYTNWYGGTSYKWSTWSQQSVSVTSQANYKCYSDAQCADTEYCSENNCISECKPVIAQSDCGHIVDHNWVNYECCGDEACSSDKQCSNNYCVSVPCACGYISNHQCIKYECCSNSDCSYGDYCSNNQCLKYECVKNSDCDGDKICSNNHCLPLTCNSCEHIVDHNCIKYDCCSNTECASDENCNNHKCEKTLCGFGSKIDNHECNSALDRSGSYLFPLISLIVIGTLIFIFVKQAKKIKNLFSKKGKEKSDKVTDKKCKCGAFFEGHEKFCHKCGRKIKH